MDNCKACQTKLIWLRHHQSNQLNPIEDKPHLDGNLVISRAKGLYRFATEKEIELARTTGKNLYISHFATCRFAEIFNGKPKTKRQK
jgi:hypothetical protein